MKAVRFSPAMNKTSGQRIWMAVLTGLLLFLATPPVPLGFLAWFALIPLLISLENVIDGKEAFRLGMWTGLVYHLGTIYWIAFNTGADWGARLGSAAGGIGLMTILVGFVAWLHYFAVKRFGKSGHLLIIMLWPAQDMLFMQGELGFPWVTLALTQAEYLPIIQIASVGGTPLVSAWVAAINGIAAAGRDRKMTSVVLILIVLMTWGGGYIREYSISVRDSENNLGSIALVQGNIEPAKKWELGADHSLGIYWSITRNVINAEKPILVVWPETAAPVYLKRSRQWRNKMQAFVDSVGVPVATGGSHYEIENGVKNRYNSSFLIKPGAKGVMDWYAKIHLVPFGERVPFQKIYPDLGKLNFGQAEFKPGSGIKAWEIDGKDGQVKVSPLICYEAIFPDLGRDAVRAGAQVIINHTNDGWLAGTSEPEQHLLLSRFRSIETGLALVRATNTGISAIISPSGRILRKLPEGIRGALTAGIPEPVKTPYIKGGWLFGYIMVVVTILIWLKLVSDEIRKRWKTNKLPSKGE
ncbi:MAG: apolipoprotein N-acyltransferase [Candidatus Electryonea clarkiae]|nr:apolipoprotein N-acyltransferase [Candidatus Electryonea clarkiae]MDP8286276.1 apolipoprotein N-acyltransferase [Candidatus Electryonea clarkiae]